MIYKVLQITDRLRDKFQQIRRRGPKEDSQFKHMGWIVENFRLEQAPSEPGATNVLWDNNVVYKTPALKSLRNTASGDCFLVGTGPSIGEIDFSKLRAKVCFGVNGSIVKFRMAGFAPAYYAIATRDFFYNRFNMVHQAIESKATCFFPFWGLCRICKNDTALLQNASIYLMYTVNKRYGIPMMNAKAFDKRAAADPDLILHKTLKRAKDAVGFSLDLEKGYFHGENVLFVAIQIARYIGFRRLFILGMDLDYSRPNPRFYENASDSRPTWIDKSFERSIVPAFEVLRNMCLEKQIEVYNLSLKSKLPEKIIPKISFEKAIELSEMKIDCPC